LSENIKLPIYQIIGDFLKSQINTPFTLNNLVRNLLDSQGNEIKRSTISSSLTYLSKGRKITKKGKILITKSGKPRRKFYKGFGKGKIRKISKGEWVYFKKTNYESWKVWFKLKETVNPDPIRKWKDNMDLSANVEGVIPSGTLKKKIIETVGYKLLRETLIIMEGEGVALWDSVREDGDEIVYGATKNDNLLINDRYDSHWSGEIIFVNDLGKKYDPFPVKYDIMEHEYD
jgi:hypothetical protein